MDIYKKLLKISAVFIAVFAMFAIWGNTQAHADTIYGDQTLYGGQNGNEDLWLNRVYVSSSGVMTSISGCTQADTGSDTVYLGLYSDNSGVPGNLIYGPVSGSVNNTTEQFITVSTTPTSISAGYYWLAISVSGTTNDVCRSNLHSNGAQVYALTRVSSWPSTASPVSNNYGPEGLYMTVSNVAAPTVTSPTATSITTTTATLGGNVTSDGGATISSRGVCVGTSANPTTSGTCFTTSGTTGTFTVSATGLTSGTTYHYRAYATNSVGTSYTTDDTFTTLSTTPTSVSANTATNVNSYYVTLNGSANPNGYTTTGHFRIYTSNPGSCTSDSGGTRVPVSTAGTDDVSVGSDSLSHNFSYTTTYENPGYLTPQTQYWVCAYGINTNGTTGSSSVGTFTTPDGPANPCDAPTSGNLVIPAGASCSFPGDNYDGISSTSSITFSSGSVLTANPGQNIGRGSSMVFSGGTLTLGGGVMVRGGVYIKDADGDGVIDGDADTYGYVGTTPPTGYVQRSTISSTYNYSKKVLNISTFDCNSSNGNVYQNVANLVTDADHDGYQTSAAASTQCVGAAASFNGRTYYKDTSGNYTWLPSSAVLGSGVTDCNDNDSTPCVPSITSETATSIDNDSATVGFDLNSFGGSSPRSYWFNYGTTNTGSCSTLANSTSSTSYFSDGTKTKFLSGLTYNTTYYYCGAATSSFGTGYGSIQSFTTTNTCYLDNDGDGYGTGSVHACGGSYTAINSTDCYDSNSNAHPGQTSYFSTNRGDGSYDYDCDGSTTKNSALYGYQRMTTAQGNYNVCARYYKNVSTGTCVAVNPSCSGSSGVYGGSDGGVISSSTACGTGYIGSYIYSDSNCSTLSSTAVIASSLLALSCR